MSASDAARRIALCATGKSGLGHLRRLTNIALQLRKQRPTLHLDLYTNAEPAALSTDELGLFAAVRLCERSEMAARLVAEEHELVLVDTAVLPGLEQVRGRLCLVLRETIESRLHEFRLGARRRWDLVLLPNPPATFDPPAELLGAQRLESVGWIYRAPEDGDAGAVHSAAGGLRGRLGLAMDMPLLLIACGGGGNAITADRFAALVDPLIQRTRGLMQRRFEAVLACGPRAAPPLAQVDASLTPGADLNRWFAEADAVISTTGYNSALELALLDVPAVLVPINRSLDDQRRRAAELAKVVGAMLEPDSVDSVAAWLAVVLDQGRRRSPLDLGGSGALRAARSLLALLDSSSGDVRSHDAGERRRQ